MVCDVDTRFLHRHAPRSTVDRESLCSQGRLSARHATPGETAGSASGVRPYRQRRGSLLTRSSVTMPCCMWLPYVLAVGRNHAHECP